MPHPHDAQTALITGAGRGIGRTIALHLASHGMRVGVAARTASQVDDTVASIAATGGEAMPLVCDVLDLDAVTAAVNRLTGVWGRLDLLVNNAGLLSSMGPLWETEPAAWRQDVAVNIDGVYHGCRAAVPFMLEAGRGRIINMVGGGTTGPFLNASAYACSKAAVMRLTENLALELDVAGAPVRVFALTPGLVRTEMTEQFLQTAEGRRWMSHTGAMLEDGRHLPPTVAARLVAAVAAGEMDAYHGRFLSAPGDGGDLPALAAAGSKLDPGDHVRRLRIVQA